MGSNFHFTIDLNEDQNDQSFFSPLGSSLHHLHHQVPSYFPISTNTHLDQVQNKNAFDGFLDPNLSQNLETKKFVCNGGSSSSDQMVPKKEKRLKLTIRKKDYHQDQFDLPQYQRKGETETNSLKWVSSKVRLKKKKTLISTTDNNKEHVNNEQSLNLSNLEGHHHDYPKKLSTNQFSDNGYNGSNNCVIRICSDCNTTKTPLWRSGPRGPKSLCNACGIRQRKARRAAMAATMNSDSSPPLLKKKMQNKNKRQNGVCNLSYPSASKVKKCKRMIRTEEAEPAGDLETHSKPMMSSSSTSSSSKFYFDDLDIILSKSSAYQQVFPQDEKEAAVLLMALSYGMVHG